MSWTKPFQLHFRHVNIHSEGITLKTYEICGHARKSTRGIGKGEWWWSKIGEVRQINSKDTALLNSTSINPARKETPLVSR
jgi:hypothetical protein